LFPACSMQLQSGAHVASASPPGLAASFASRSPHKRGSYALTMRDLARIQSVHRGLGQSGVHVSGQLASDEPFTEEEEVRVSAPAVRESGAWYVQGDVDQMIGRCFADELR